MCKMLVYRKVPKTVGMGNNNHVPVEVDVSK